MVTEACFGDPMVTPLSVDASTTSKYSSFSTLLLSEMATDTTELVSPGEILNLIGVTSKSDSITIIKTMKTPNVAISLT